MQVSGWLVSALVVVAITSVIGARWIIKGSILRGRKPLSLPEIYRQDEALLGVNYEIFENVIDVIGQAYHVDPRLLRPADRLKKLYDLDSWDLGEGTEQLRLRLACDFGITRFDPEPQTIAELIAAIARERK